MSENLQSVRLTLWIRHSHEKREEFPEEKARREKGLAQMQADLARKTPTNVADRPQWRRILYTICGYEPPSLLDVSDEEADDQEKVLTSIEETPKWKWFVNINALVLMTFGIFLWGFFA